MSLEKPVKPIYQQNNLFSTQNPFDAKTIQQTEYTKKFGILKFSLEIFLG